MRELSERNMKKNVPSLVNNTDASWYKESAQRLHLVILDIVKPVSHQPDHAL